MVSLTLGLTDLCVAAALDAVKEHAHLPWTTPREAPSSIISMISTEGKESVQTLDNTLANTPSSQEDGLSGEEKASTATENEEIPKRILRMSHFEKALKEITPSASEQLGSLADLRKWNEEFGEGGRKRGKRIWGGKFGFIVKAGESNEGRVQRP